MKKLQFGIGPVDKEKLIIAAWDWKDNAQTFRLHFGIDISKAESLREENKNIKIAPIYAGAATMG